MIFFIAQKYTPATAMVVGAVRNEIAFEKMKYGKSISAKDTDTVVLTLSVSPQQQNA